MIQRSPTSLTVKTYGILNFLLIIACVLIGQIYPFFNLSENQTLYIFSSMAQVIAGIFGLTIAGYTFLRNQQDRLVDKDDTLIEIFERIQGNQHRLVEFITALSVISILSALLVIALRESSNQNIKLAATYISLSLFVSSILWTAYFVIEVTRPEKISNESKIIKAEIISQVNTESELGGRNISEDLDNLNQKISPNKNNNHFSDFMRNFNIIEKYLVGFAEFEFGSKSQEKFNFDLINDMPNKNFTLDQNVNWPISKIVKALFSEAIINKEFSNEILSIIKYRNALIHGEDLSVDLNMLSRVVAAVKKLRLSIEKHYSSL